MPGKSLTSRLCRLEADAADSRLPTHEEALEALWRIESPPAGYTAAQRATDIGTLQLDAAALAAAGLE